MSNIQTDCQKRREASTFLSAEEMTKRAGAPYPNGRRWTDEYGDSCTLWVVLPGTMSEEEAKATVEKIGFAPEPLRCHHSYDCCGRWYFDSYWLRRGGSRWLCTWHHYRNV